VFPNISCSSLSVSNSSDNEWTLSEGIALPPDNDSSPFNLSEVPSGLESDDSMQQHDVFNGVLLAQQGPSAGPTWEQTIPMSLKLSRLERIFSAHAVKDAIPLLGRRINLRFDNDYVYPSDDVNLMWDAKKHFLDFILIVSDAIGLYSFLPNTVSDHTFTITLDFRLQSRTFKAKFGKLGFDPTGSMMAIGEGNGCELWLGFCPLANIDDINIANEVPLLNEKHGDTHLSTVRFRMAVMFMAFVLSKIPEKSIQVWERYGLDEDFSTWRISDASNL
jgi:hypothetical protein